MHFLSSPQFLALRVSQEECEEVFAKAKSLLLAVTHPAHRSKVEAIALPEPRGELSMLEAISHYLKGFCTQQAGGFQTDGMANRNHISQRLQQQITSFNGLDFGIECPENSIITDLPHCHAGGELVVYDEEANISPQRIVRTGVFPDGSNQKVMLQEFEHHDKTILTGHCSSGTQNPLRDPHNRDLFISIYLGTNPLQPENIDMSSYFAVFFDANFDVTSHTNIEQLIAASVNSDLQIAFPAVRIKKQRIANAPFENNQLNKGGKQKIAESMVLVTSKARSLIAVDTELYVIHSGKIFSLRQETRKELSLHDLHFTVYNALSTEVVLDHMPIRCAIDNQWVSFHNFMEFKGVRGIEEGWYDKPQPFLKAQQTFIDWLASRFLA